MQVCCIKLKVHSTKLVVFQNMITAVLLWNPVPPSRHVPVQNCLLIVYKDYVVFQNMITAVPVLL